VATHDEIRAIALKFPGAEETADRFGFHVPLKVKGQTKYKGFAWAWLERVDPKKGRVPNNNVLAIRTPSLEAKELILASDPIKFFTEPHYNGYPAVLVRIAEATKEDFEDLLLEAWRCTASKDLLSKYAD
jgi:hypothetical protein